MMESRRSNPKEEEEIPKRRAWTIPTGEWWWVGGFIVCAAENNGRYYARKAALPPIQWEVTYQSNGVSLRGTIPDVDTLLATVVGTQTETFISATEGEQRMLEDFWLHVVNSLIRTEKEARSINRQATGAKFQDVLDEFYRRQRAGLSPKLSALAKEYGVNYGSLRQAKVTYDRERQQEL
jgi:hypothetical protein